MFQHLAPHQPICARMPSPTTRCAPPRRGFHNGTVSITSIGGVASTFVLKWLKAQDELGKGKQAVREIYRAYETESNPWSPFFKPTGVGKNGPKK